MKKILFIISFVLACDSYFSQDKVHVWLEKDYSVVATFDHASNEIFVVNVENIGKSEEDCNAKAKIQALYHVIFNNVSQTKRAKGSRKLATDEEYKAKESDFINFLVDTKDQGGKYIEQSGTNQNTGVLKLEKKKYKTNTIVYIKKMDLKAALETKGWILSPKAIIESLGYRPSVFVVPGDIWMYQENWITKAIDGGQENFDYISSSKNIDLDYIGRRLENRFNSVFDIKSLKSVVDRLAIVDVQDNVRTKKAADNDRLTRDAKPDLRLKVDYVKADPKKGGLANEIELSFKAEDPFTGSPVASTDVIRISTVGVKSNDLLDAAINSACDQFEAEILRYLVSREKNGLKGRLSFISTDDNIDFKLTKVKYNGRTVTLEQILPALVQTRTQKPAKQASASNNTEIPLEITIPTKSKDVAGNIVSNNFQLFAEDIMSDIYLLGGEFDVVTEQLGVGDVQILFKKKSKQ